MQGAYEMRLMYEANQLKQIEGVANDNTAMLKSESHAAFRLATAGSGMTVIDQSNVSNVSSTSGDTVLVALRTDHEESSAKNYNPNQRYAFA